jgi:hypothetical protein
VLEREDGRRRQHRDLLAVHHRLERRPHRDFRLAVADVAAQQAVHRRRRLHVALDVGDGVLLIDRQVPLERVLELLLPVAVGTERVAGDGLAGGVELEQLLRHVAHLFLDARLGLLPRRPAQLVERGREAPVYFWTRSSRSTGDEELVFPGVAELHELLRLEADLDLLQAHEDADAVVDVDDQVADLQVAEVGEEGAGRGPALLVGLTLLVEDVGFRPQLEGRPGRRKPLDRCPTATSTAAAGASSPRSISAAGTW